MPFRTFADPKRWSVDIDGSFQNRCRYRRENPRSHRTSTDTWNTGHIYPGPIDPAHHRKMTARFCSGGGQIDIILFPSYKSFVHFSVKYSFVPSQSFLYILLPTNQALMSSLPNDFSWCITVPNHPRNRHGKRLEHRLESDEPDVMFGGNFRTKGTACDGWKISYP